MLKLGDLAVAGALALGLKAYLDRMPTPKPTPTPQAGQLIGWDTSAEFYAGIDKWAASGKGLDLSAVVGTDIPHAKKPEPFVLPEGAAWGKPVTQDWRAASPPLTQTQIEEIGGPSKLSLTRPKGLD